MTKVVDYICTNCGHTGRSYEGSDEVCIACGSEMSRAIYVMHDLVGRTCNEPIEMAGRKAIEMYEAEINEKMEFISDAERELQDLIEVAVIRLQSEYKGKFGGFRQHDIWLWINCRLEWPIIWNSGMVMDVVEDDE